MKKSSKVLIIVAAVIVLIVVGHLLGGKKIKPIVNEPVKTESVMNGSKDTILGKRGYITLSRERFDAMTSADAKAFVEKQSDKKLLWLTINIEDGHALQFQGSLEANTYGKADDQGRIIEPLGTYRFDKDKPELIK